VQYLSPIIKNRQYNFPPIGINPFVGAAARPNEITYSEDKLNPHLPPPPPPNSPAAANEPNATPPPVTTRSADPSQGLQGLMIPASAAPAPPGGAR
jgi:phospholipid/cholesterol/gamma-HCH transport system substrate-binding protein